jgi:glucose/arabinose dehydrogenase
VRVGESQPRLRGWLRCEARFAMTALVLIAALSGAVSGGCSSTASSTTSTVSTLVAAPTTTSPPTTEAKTTTTVKVAPSGPLDPSQVAGDPDGVYVTTLPNGRKKAFGTFAKAWSDGTGRQVTFNLQAFLTGQAAVDAAHADGAIPSGQEYVDNDYYIRDQSPMTYSMSVSNSVRIVGSDPPGDPTPRPFTWDMFTQAIARSWWVELAGDEIVSITEQWRP